jgi:hypothetical protein
MKPFRVAGWLCALGLVAADAGAARAAWCNVFQVCCGHCRKPAVANYYAPPAANCCAPPPCCPQPVCTTRYTLRCYYQPVTCYQTKTYYEPVTTYQTSYYYEPVTSYRYSCYFDPCSCSYQQVACPTTCYQLRSQCCPVQSWVQRCCQVPVTTYQRSFYWEPSTCCSAPAASPCAAPVASQVPAANYAPTAPPPVAGNPPPAKQPPAVSDTQGGNGTKEYDRYYPPNDVMPPASYRQVPPNPGAVRPLKAAPPAPQIRLDRIVANPATRLEGQVVRTDNAPRANVQLRFVSGDRRGPIYPVTANSAGRFRVTLTSGSWLVYMSGPDGREWYHSKIEVKGDGTRRVTLVSR